MDIAVHSLKDLPLEDPQGLVLCANLARSEGRVALVSRSGATLDQLPSNAVVGTSSTRRAAQILARRPDLHVRSIRGNVDTRLRKLDSGDYDAIVLAGAGLVRMGLGERVGQWLPIEWFTPAPGQGALAVQCRADDAQIRTWLAAIHEPDLALLVQAERSFLAALGGGCSEPVGAWAWWQASNDSDGDEPARDEPSQGRHANSRQLTLQAWYSTPDGQTTWSRTIQGKTGLEAATEAANLARREVGHDNSHSNHFGLQESSQRVGLTRSLAEGLRDCRSLLSAGMQPILAPVLEMVAELSGAELVARVGEVGPIDWLIFTSANAVRIFQTLWQQGSGEQCVLDKCHVAAVGPHTAAAATEAGFRVAVTPDIYSGDGLSVLAHRFSGARVIIPRSAIGRNDWLEAIEAHAREIVEIPLYRPKSRVLEEQAIEAMLRGMDAVTFASGSAVRAFRSEIDRVPALANAVDNTLVACIGPQTAKVAQEHGFRVGMVSETYTMLALIQALASRITERQNQIGE
jgi:hydroxymethylbilane synthase